MSFSLPASNKHSDHPGHSVRDCVCSIKVDAQRMSMNGYACAMSGGHCVPGAYCASRVVAFNKEQT